MPSLKLHPSHPRPVVLTAFFPWPSSKDYKTNVNLRAQGHESLGCLRIQHRSPEVDVDRRGLGVRIRKPHSWGGQVPRNVNPVGSKKGPLPVPAVKVPGTSGQHRQIQYSMAQVTKEVLSRWQWLGASGKTHGPHGRQRGKDEQIGLEHDFTNTHGWWFLSIKPWVNPKTLLICHKKTGSGLVKAISVDCFKATFLGKLNYVTNQHMSAMGDDFPNPCWP